MQGVAYLLAVLGLLLPVNTGPVFERCCDLKKPIDDFPMENLKTGRSASTDKFEISHEIINEKHLPDQQIKYIPAVLDDSSDSLQVEETPEIVVEKVEEFEIEMYNPIEEYSPLNQGRHLGEKKLPKYVEYVYNYIENNKDNSEKEGKESIDDKLDYSKREDELLLNFLKYQQDRYGIADKSSDETKVFKPITRIDKPKSSQTKDETRPHNVHNHPNRTSNIATSAGVYRLQDEVPQYKEEKGKRNLRAVGPNVNSLNIQAKSNNRFIGISTDVQIDYENKDRKSRSPTSISHDKTGEKFDALSWGQNEKPNSKKIEDLFLGGQAGTQHLNKGKVNQNEDTKEVNPSNHESQQTQDLKIGSFAIPNKVPSKLGKNVQKWKPDEIIYSPISKFNTFDGRDHKNIETTFNSFVKIPHNEFSGLGENEENQNLGGLAYSSPMFTASTNHEDKKNVNDKSLPNNVVSRFGNGLSYLSQNSNLYPELIEISKDVEIKLYAFDIAPTNIDSQYGKDDQTKNGSPKIEDKDEQMVFIQIEPNFKPSKLEKAALKQKLEEVPHSQKMFKIDSPKTEGNENVEIISYSFEIVPENVPSLFGKDEEYLSLLEPSNLEGNINGKMNSEPIATISNSVSFQNEKLKSEEATYSSQIPKTKFTTEGSTNVGMKPPNNIPSKYEKYDRQQRLEENPYVSKNSEIDSLQIDANKRDDSFSKLLDSILPKVRNDDLETNNELSLPETSTSQMSTLSSSSKENRKDSKSNTLGQMNWKKNRFLKNYRISAPALEGTVESNDNISDMVEDFELTDKNSEHWPGTKSSTIPISLPKMST